LLIVYTAGITILSEFGKKTYMPYAPSKKKSAAVSQKPAADFFISSLYISTILQIDRQGQL
jgi:hypothetical protein